MHFPPKMQLLGLHANDMVPIRAQHSLFSGPETATMAPWYAQFPRLRGRAGSEHRIRAQAGSEAETGGRFPAVPNSRWLKPILLFFPPFTLIKVLFQKWKKKKKTILPLAKHKRILKIFILSDHSDHTFHILSTHSDTQSTKFSRTQITLSHNSVSQYKIFPLARSFLPDETVFIIQVQVYTFRRNVLLTPTSSSPRARVWLPEWRTGGGICLVTREMLKNGMEESAS